MIIKNIQGMIESQFDSSRHQENEADKYVPIRVTSGFQ